MYAGKSFVKLLKTPFSSNPSWFGGILILSLVFHLGSGERNALLKLSSGAEIPGQYVGIGAADTFATGVLHDVGNCTKRSSLEDDQATEWIAVVSLPEVYEPEHQKRTAQSTTCSILDQVKQAMLLGGSALLILALKPAILKQLLPQLDTQQEYKKPIVAVTSKKAVDTIKKDMTSVKTVRAIISPVSEKGQVVDTPRLTLWSTCGKASGGTHREWEGTVCLGETLKENQLSVSALWQVVFSGIVSVYLVIMLRQWRRPFRNTEDVEVSLQRLAKFSVSKMPTKRYKKKRFIDEPEKDSCAICLDEFHHGQVIRMLPCYHHFHSKCVDTWLIRKRTCPLCKMDIVDQRFS